MSNLLSTLNAAAGSMRALERALSVVQNNVSNISTAGYAKQRVSFIPNAFQPDLGLPGGLQGIAVISARSSYAERAVWTQAERFGRLDQLGVSLAGLEPAFDITGQGGLASALDALYRSFSAWSVVPNDGTARQNVIQRAGETASAFSHLAGAIQRSGDTASVDIRSTVAKINDLAGQIRDINIELRRNHAQRQDANLDARIQSTLEELSHLAGITVLEQPDGTLNLLLGGQSPLVMGDTLYAITAEFSGSAKIADWQGRDISGLIQQGRLGGLLEFRNQHIPGYLTELNRLAQSLADRVNGLLRTGVDLNGAPGSGLFTYNPALGAAASLRVALTPAQLAASLPGEEGGNGVALSLAGLVSSQEIDGLTFTQFYGNLAAEVGRTLNSARQAGYVQGLTLTQARNLRAEISSVSLDEEAVHLIQFQRAYQAAAKMVSVLDEMTETLLGMVR